MEKIPTLKKVYKENTLDSEALFGDESEFDEGFSPSSNAKKVGEMRKGVDRRRSRLSYPKAKDRRSNRDRRLLSSTPLIVDSDLPRSAQTINDSD